MLTSEMLGLEAVVGELLIAVLREVSVPGGESELGPRPALFLFWAAIPESGCRIFIINPSSSCSIELKSLGLTYKSTL